MSDRAVHWSEAYLRRAAAAIREHYTTDVVVLARRALEAAVRNEQDLLDLLDDRKKPAFRAKSEKAA